MSPLDLALTGGGLIVGAGVLAVVLCRTPHLATLVAALGAFAGCAVGLVAAILGLHEGWVGQVAWSWPVPGGALVLGLDRLSAFFLAPLFGLGGLAAVYGRRYLADHSHGATVALAGAAFNLLLGAMVVVVIARHAVVFLVAWEVMTLLAYLLVTLDHERPEVRRAGWVYLIASHVATMALFAMFLLYAARAGGALDFEALARAGERIPILSATLLLTLALLGFGIKAGVVGLHVWLPEAHAAAPSHVSALMSGVLIKLGIYGLLRMLSLVPSPAWFGLAVAALGLLGAIVGISLALYQRDLKRVLAYSSVENVGVILLGVGLGVWAHATGRTRLATFAYAGSLLHLLNHAAMKGLMFLGAGSVLHATGDKDVERLGGLLRRMPWTGRAWIVGSVAIAGLPPLNGFMGEWLLYSALASIAIGGPAVSGLAAIAAVAGLAVVGGLAAFCFVRLIGVVLLGEARGAPAAAARESSPAMTAPLAVLAAFCVFAAIAPGRILGLAGPLIASLAGGGPADVGIAVSALAPLAAMSGALTVGLVLVGTLVAWRARRPALTETWGCGYASPSPRMQYTGRSFSEMLVERLLPRWLRLRRRTRLPEGPFPPEAAYASDAQDPLTRGAYEPLLAVLGDRFARLRWLQQGSLHIYLVYIVAVVVLSLVWVSAREWWSFRGSP